MTDLTEQQKRILKVFAEHRAITLTRNELAGKMGNVDLLETGIRALKTIGFIIVKFMDFTVTSIGFSPDKNEIFMSGVISGVGINYYRSLV
jgi:hypothetical protein